MAKNCSQTPLAIAFQQLGVIFVPRMSSLDFPEFEFLGGFYHTPAPGKDSFFFFSMSPES